MYGTAIHAPLLLFIVKTITLILAKKYEDPKSPFVESVSAPVVELLVQQGSGAVS